MKILKPVIIAILFCILTILSQTGGIIYLLSLTTHGYINKKLDGKIVRWVVKLFSFLLIYFSCTFFIVPLLAGPFGRVPLPLTEQDNVKPLNIITCLLNRHYVRPQLKNVLIDAARQMNACNPGTAVNYLDAGFPFINKFPLFPHLSHNDGKKLDIAFFYLTAKTGKPANTAPSPIGYGISEEPAAGEINMSEICASQGYHLYSLMRRLVPQGNKKNFTFDSVRTRQLINILVNNATTGKIFIEPHLKIRMHLTDSKIRFQGCNAVRHDDHIHLQLK